MNGKKNILISYLFFFSLPSKVYIPGVSVSGLAAFCLRASFVKLTLFCGYQFNSLDLLHVKLLIVVNGSLVLTEERTYHMV